MSDSIRAALERLIARLDETADPDGPVPAWVDSYCAARAALAEPAPPAEGEVAELVEFLRIYGDEVMDEYGDVGEHDKLTRAADLLEQRHPAPVPEEAANPWKDALIDTLVCNFLLNEENQSDPRRALHDLISWEVQLARDPLINPPVHPTPVPVSEGLPGPEDCDAEGRCWLFSKVEKEWRLIDAGNPGVPHLKYCFSHWLPTHALPLPQGEVEP